MSTSMCMCVCCDGDCESNECRGKKAVVRNRGRRSVLNIQGYSRAHAHNVDVIEDLANDNRKKCSVRRWTAKDETRGL
jgi:hypothetical protein